MIKVINYTELTSILNRWEDNTSLKEDEGLFISYDFESDKFICLANDTLDCYIEEFNSLGIALIYLVGNYESIQLLYNLDEAFENDINNIVYMIDEIEVSRGIRHKNKSTANELLAIGFNKEKNPELFFKYIQKIVDKFNLEVENHD